MRKTLGSPDHKSPITNHESFRLLTLLPYAVFLLLAAATWNRWIEPYVDTGRELMVPWRIARGERLYADVHFHHGPLGPWIGAAIERIAPRSLGARGALAMLLALLHVAALERLARRIFSLRPRRAALASAIAVAAAVFLRPGGWLFPFSFDAAIAVLGLTGALVFITRPDAPAADGRAGLCVLAALLARPELALAGVGAIAASFVRAPRRLLPLAAAPAAAASLVYAGISAGIPFDRLVADGWLRMLDPPDAFRNVYLAYAGLDRIGLRMAELSLAAILLGVLAIFLLAVAFAVSRARRPGAPSNAAGLAAVVGATGLAAAVCLNPPPIMAATISLLPPLPRVIPIALVAASAARLATRLGRREPRGSLSSVPDAVLWTAGLFALRLLLAAGYVGPYDSFFLPLPIIVATAGLYGLADRTAAAGLPATPRLCSAALAVFLTFRVAATIQGYRRGPWALVGTPAGALRLPEPEASTTRGALADLETRFGADSTLVGFPEAGFFNYVLGRRSPLWLDQFFPGHLDGKGERRAIEALRDRLPDATLYANVLAVGEDARVFGQDYLVDLDRTVRARSHTLSIHGPGARPGARIGDPDFFVEIRVPNPGAGGAGP